MSSPYFTGTLVEAVVEMFSCSGEYIGHGWLMDRRGERRVGSNRLAGRGIKGKGRVGADQMKARGKEKKEGQGSAEPQLHPLMLHGSVFGRTPCTVTKTGQTLVKKQYNKYFVLFCFEQMYGSKTATNINIIIPLLTFCFHYELTFKGNTSSKLRSEQPLIHDYKRTGSVSAKVCSSTVSSTVWNEYE